MSKKTGIGITGLVIVIALMAVGVLLDSAEQEAVNGQELENLQLDPVQTKKARAEYFFQLLRDPATNHIPDNIRSRELNYSRSLPSRNSGFLQKGSQANQASNDIIWQSAGPTDLGGRTRALGVDQRNSDIILAGGVSGGMWKSTDGGNTWEMKTDPNQNMSVTNLAQDPTNPDTWYYTSGEYSFGKSASDRGSTAGYYGTGIYKSTDNGKTWSRLASTEDTDVSFNSQFDYISRIIVNPTTGSVFIASNGFGVYRSTDGGSSWSSTPVIGVEGEQQYTDVNVAPDGTLVAVISESTSGSGSHNPGVFISTDDGVTWTEYTPTTFPTTHYRSVTAFAPSKPSIFYVFTYKGFGGSNQEISFHKFTLNNLASDTLSTEDRSANIPDFGGKVGGMNVQGGYNMVVSVKPDDSDFVMVGGTNLFRSRDGFATKPSGGYDNSDNSQKNEYWIGGYAKANNVSQYPSQHPDQHVIAYNPNNPDEVWAGHDGGLSLTSDITASAVDWQDKDEGYVTGQFYTVAIPANGNDDRFLGGTQDNGTPFFRFDNDTQSNTSLLDVSTGDGAYAFWGTDYAYVSTQNGKVVRLGIESDGSLTSPYDGSTSTDYSFIYPSNASNQLFIHPYTIDPNDEGIMYYPDDRTMWRNTEVDSLPSYISDGTTEGWTKFTAVNETGYTISTLEGTNSQPSDHLYYAAYSYAKEPKIFSVENASTSWNPVEISITNADAGAYTHDIVVNPKDGDELIAVMSNYNIVGLYHSTDGGSSWTAIEGNLEGDSQNPGPSLRNATILPTSSDTLYLVGTSTGVYSTTSLSASNTNWTRESDDGSPGSIGYSVAEYITSRPSDGKIAVGTHGRGIFMGQVDGGAKTINTTVDITNNWKLIGSPMISSSDVQLGSDLTIFEFSGTYKSSSVIESQKGYWVKSRSGSQIDFSGGASDMATLSLNSGWNLIGGVAETIPASSINDPNGILSSSDIFEYTSGSYQAATQIKPTTGYWIHADQKGDIELSISESSTSSKERLAEVRQSVGKLKFRQGNVTQKFYLADGPVETNTRDMFRMPPQSPNPILDVRTSDDFRLAEGKTTELELTTTSYPVKVTIPEHSTSREYVLKGVTNQDTVLYDLSAGKEAVIQRSHDKFYIESGSVNQHITEHELLPNYPNPFNPTTNIEYKIASQTHVSLSVYDVLGRRVRTLVNEVQEPGKYTKTFNGQNLSSGTYFIRINAKNFSNVRQMTLIK